MPRLWLGVRPSRGGLPVLPGLLMTRLKVASGRCREDTSTSQGGFGDRTFSTGQLALEPTSHSEADAVEVDRARLRPSCRPNPPGPWSSWMTHSRNQAREVVRRQRDGEGDPVQRLQVPTSIVAAGRRGPLHTCSALGCLSTGQKVAG